MCCGNQKNEKIKRPTSFDNIIDAVATLIVSNVIALALQHIELVIQESEDQVS
jgi:hypothetical protein